LRGPRHALEVKVSEDAPGSWRYERISFPGAINSIAITLAKIAPSGVEVSVNVVDRSYSDLLGEKRVEAPVEAKAAQMCV